MKRRITACIILLLAPTLLLAQQKLPPAAQLLSPSICGKGVFLFWLGEQSIGREEFEIKCQPDGGYVSSGHTDFKVPGGAIDLNTTLEVDKSGEPLSSTAKGTLNSQPFDQSVAVKAAVATVTTAGGTKELPFAKGTSLLGGNIFHMFQFLLAVKYRVRRRSS